MTNAIFCANVPFEWRHDVLYVVGESFDQDTAWVRQETMEQIRESAPKTDEPAMVFAIKRTPDTDDEIYLVSDFIIIPGGDALLYLDRMVAH